MAKCSDCEATAILNENAGNGTCSRCNGTAVESDPFEALGKSLMNEPQTCGKCGGSGVCPTCGGSGEV